MTQGKTTKRQLCGLVSALVFGWTDPTAAGSPLPEDVAGAISLYHLYYDDPITPTNRNSFYTTNKTGKLKKSTRWPWRFKRIEGYTWPTAGMDRVPLYRLRHRTDTVFDHLYTTSPAERDFLIAAGWEDQGIEGYVYPTRVAGTVPLQRFYSPTDIDHRLRASGRTTAPVGYEYEGVIGYVLPRQRFGIIGGSIAAATHANDACGPGKELPDCLTLRLGEHDPEWSHAGGKWSFSIARRVGYKYAQVVSVADDGAEWKDAPAQAQVLMADPGINTVFINLGNNNVCKKYGESYAGDLALIERDIDETLAYLTTALAGRPDPRIYWSSTVDIVGFYELMAGRRDNYVFTSNSHLWNLDADKLTQEALDSICVYYQGNLCDHIPGAYVDNVVEQFVDRWLREFGTDKPCGRVLDRRVTAAERAEARQFNRDLNALMARKAATWDGVNGVRVHFTDRPFKATIEPYMVSHIDAYHPSRAGQVALAQELWIGFNPFHPARSSVFLWDDNSDPDPCNQSHTRWPTCWEFDSTRGPNTSAFEWGVDNQGWLKLEKDTNANDQGWIERGIGDMSRQRGLWAFFRHKRENLDSGRDRVDFQVFDGSAWITLDSFAGGGNDRGEHASAYYDLTPYKAQNMWIRFQTASSNNMRDNDRVKFDDVTIVSW